MADVNFECVKCGKCCHNLKVPLTVTEAIDWLTDGNEVQVICEAVPWPNEPAVEDLQAAHKRRRSFPAMSGSLPSRVVVILAATFSGACPNLLPDMRCGIYERRPLVCRIYPAEINPFMELLPSNKSCPAEAWTPERPQLLRQGIVVDTQSQALIHQSRATDAREIHIKQAICAELGLNAASLSNEGFVIHSPDRLRLLNAIRRTDAETDRPAADWRYITNRYETVEALNSVGATSYLAGGQDDSPFLYVGFHPPSPPVHTARRHSTADYIHMSVAANKPASPPVVARWGPVEVRLLAKGVRAQAVLHR